jgi:transcriptional regulator with XRE-family HTH domain
MIESEECIFPLYGGVMATLGEELKRLRGRKGYTLRDVEELTRKKISNSYLYQLENDAVKEPSPHILYELAEFYKVQYKDLMHLAGYVTPNSTTDKSRRRPPLPLSAFSDVTDQELEELGKMLDYIRHRDKGKE